MNNLIKTVLAPNAPWPKQEAKPEPKPRGRQTGWRKPAPKLNLTGDLDFFAEAHDQINQAKLAIKSRVRNVSTRGLKGSQRMAG